MFVACLLVAGCGQQIREVATPNAKPPKESEGGSAGSGGLEGFMIGEPIAWENLVIYPVLSKEPRNEDLYITLEEGLNAGTVEVFEVGARAVAENTGPGADRAEPPDPDDQAVEVAGDVNRLMVVNRSEKPLYLMPGEVIYGGKQDRAIAEETIILADGKPVGVEVYCVERGRWSGRSSVTAQAGIAELASGDGEGVDQEVVEELAKESRQGKFVVKAGNLGQGGRVAVQAKKGQQAVWDEVSAANAAVGVQTDSDTFTANFTDKKVREKADKYLERIETPIAELSQVVGAIVAINGETKAVDVFGSTPLFRKVWPKLLKGHVLDAMAVADSSACDKLPSRDDARTFMVKVMNANVEERTEGGLVVTKREDEDVVSFSAAMPADDMDAATEDAVHYSGFSK
jgi:hypothetical protein